MPPRKKFTVADDEEVAAKPSPKSKKSARESVDRRLSVRDRLITVLRPAMEKQGGNLGMAEDMVHLHDPKGYTPTGIYAMDMLLSGKKGGIPWGRFVEISGPESAGKSGLCEFFMGRFHRAGGIVHHADTEHTRDDERIERCYDLGRKDFIDVDPPHLEAVWDYAYTLVKNIDPADNIPHLLVLDSLAATPSKDELDEKNHEDAHVGLQARSNAKGVRKTVRLFSSSSAVFVFVNQQRDKIGAMGYGPKTDTPGGRAVKYAYSIRLQVNRIQSIKNGDTVVGQLIKVTSQKNKHAPPKMECEIVLSYKTGIDVHASNLLFFQEAGVVKAGGKNGYVFDKEHTIPKSEWSTWAEENKELLDEKAKEVVDKMLSKFTDEDVSDSSSDAEDD